jgi:hypothetical protein
LREVRATKLTAGDVADVIGGEILILYAGKLSFRAIMVPASDFWHQKVFVEYASTGHVIRVTRETLTAAHIQEIVTQQVDSKWNPYAYGELSHAEKVRAFILPDNLFWRAVVQERTG